MNNATTNYGRELILDLHNCNPEKFTRKHIRQFMKEMCKRINVRRATFYWWDYHGYPKEKEAAPAHLKGTTAIQFLYVSDIRIHTLDELRAVYVNIFTCGKLDNDIVKEFTEEYFEGEIVQCVPLDRK